MFEEFLLTQVRSRGIQCAIETGTNQARTTKVLARHFLKVFSIELSQKLFIEAIGMDFVNRDGVEFIHGDSAEHVALLANDIDAPCFWYLDAHFCDITGNEATSEFPLWKELEAIRERENLQDVIWVDDVHTFGEARPDLGQPWEDVTVDAVKELFPDRTLVVVDDGLVVL